MYTDDYQFQKDLLTHKVYSSWQFIEYARKNMAIVNYCFMTLKNIIEKMTMQTVQWEQKLFSDFVIENVTIDGKNAKQIVATIDNQSVYELDVAGEKVDPWFLFDKLLKDFYQYNMNSLDSVGQIANAGLLANKGKKVDAVDFQKMVSTFAQQTYKTAFPKTSAWFENVSNSTEFKYIEAINNRLKHTADISNKLSMGILGSSNKAEFGSFFRKGIQHNKRDLIAQLQTTDDFLHHEWEKFLTAFCDEFVLDRYIENRRHKIGGVYQQKIKGEPEQNLSYAFIPVDNNFDSMPKEIYILLASDKEKIRAHICPFENILVRQNEHNIVGRYVAEDTIGEDCLLSYRKYVKDENTDEAVCLFYEQQKETQFYHNNPFFDIVTVSNDEDLIIRSNMPF